jgi:hypothetical protein
MDEEESPSTDGLVTLQERIVNLINQMQIPLVEVSMVISNHIKQMMRSLNDHILDTGNSFSSKVMQPWELESLEIVSSQQVMDLDKILSIVDDDRMDILSTLIRVTLIESELDLIEGILAMRMWEHLARTQLSQIKTPGQLFSPITIPEEW